MVKARTESGLDRVHGDDRAPERHPPQGPRTGAGGVPRPSLWSLLRPDEVVPFRLPRPWDSGMPDSGMGISGG